MLEKEPDSFLLFCSYRVGEVTGKFVESMGFVCGFVLVSEMFYSELYYLFVSCKVSG